MTSTRTRTSHIPADLAARPRLLSAQEAADRLRVAPRTIATWAETGKLPAIKTPGGRWRFNPDDVTAAVQAMTARRPA